MKDWWKETTIYQIYPRSFYDSNGDGIGDLPGIIEKLDYIRDMGFETIWLSPHYASPQRDFGYDITDYFSVAPEYGTTDDALALIDEVHSRDMKIVFDMILNHTSDQHPWFLESRSSKDNPRRDWYIWKKGKGGGKPPTNWACLPGGSGWKYDSTTDEWFFHNFLDFQPDLNFRNPEVKQAMFETMRYWLDRGVDGFRLDIFHSIFKDDQFRDNPFSWKYVPTSDFDEGYFQKLEYNINRPETFELAREVRALIDEYEPDRFVVGEVFGKNVVKKYLGPNQDGLNLILLFDLIELQGNDKKSEEIRGILNNYETNYATPYIPTYCLGNHDRRRYMSRIAGNADLARLLALLQYTARGVPITYYGDEIGIPDGDLPHMGAKDATAHKYWWLPPAVARGLNLYVNRDGCRTPMQWNGEKNAGFSKEGDSEPWLPVHPDYRQCNVGFQRTQPFSLLNVHRELLHLRKEMDCLRRGSMHLLEGVPEPVVAYSRKGQGQELRIFMNFSPAPVRFSHSSGKLRFSTSGETALEDGYTKLGPWSGLVLEL
ncbi:MAG: glucohydrolase [Spirochaetaceae bacterium]|nr:glucohydrolase [Spirochaetaceae bacterium]|tara:strand:+ start:127141 stop:128769 length:1629 start_codon:yes stop_codon:yes gene_type:complete